MKKLILILITGLFCLEILANEPSGTWIKLDDGKYFCREINVHANRARIVLLYGERMIVPIEMVKAFSTNGREFEKLPLYKYGKITDRQVFMELIFRSKDCSLYRFGKCRIKCVQGRVNMYDYFIYKGESLQVAGNCIGLPEACRINPNKIRYK